MTEMKFIADVMVGKLARWLRVLGFDVAYSNQYDDDEIIRRANDEHRIILTKDTRLAARKLNGRCLLIESGNYKEQLQQVLGSLGLKDFNVFSRCLECNAVLEDIDREAVRTIPQKLAGAGFCIVPLGAAKRDAESGRPTAPTRARAGVTGLS